MPHWMKCPSYRDSHPGQPGPRGLSSQVLWPEHRSLWQISPTSSELVWTKLRGMPSIEFYNPCFMSLQETNPPEEDKEERGELRCSCALVSRTVKLLDPCLCWDWISGFVRWTASYYLRTSLAHQVYPRQNNRFDLHEAMRWAMQKPLDSIFISCMYVCMYYASFVLFCFEMSSHHVALAGLEFTRSTCLYLQMAGINCVRPHPLYSFITLFCGCPVKAFWPLLAPESIQIHLEYPEVLKFSFRLRAPTHGTDLEPLIDPWTSRLALQTMKGSLTFEGQNCLAVLHYRWFSHADFIPGLCSFNWDASGNTQGALIGPAHSALGLSHSGELHLGLHEFSWLTIPRG
jgi:hypothetical protein